MKTASSTNDKLQFGCSPAYVINSMITLAIMIGFKYIVPAVDPLTPLGVEILGIFLGTLYGWLVVGDVVWPSVACMIFLVNHPEFLEQLLQIQDQPIDIRDLL